METTTTSPALALLDSLLEQLPVLEEQLRGLFREEWQQPEALFCIHDLYTARSYLEELASHMRKREEGSQT